MGVAYLLKLVHHERESRHAKGKGREFVRALLEAFDVAVDAFMYVDKGDGVLILSDIEERNPMKGLGMSDLLNMGARGCAHLRLAPAALLQILVDKLLIACLSGYAAAAYTHAGRLRTLDSQNTDYVSFFTFLPAFLHWVDPDLDDV